MSKKNKIVLNIPVDEYTSPINVFATEDMKLSDIISQMRGENYRHVPVVSDGKPVGILSDRDLKLVATLNDVCELTAKDVMVPDPYCVYKGTSIEDVAFDMAERKIGSALVVAEGGTLDGIFTSIDALNALIDIVRGDVEIAQ